jgi:hypothetical protein
MNGHTLPGFVLALAKDSGQPLQLINAFLDPKEPKLADAREAMLKHHDNLKRVWGIQPTTELRFSEDGAEGETNFTDLITTLTQHVH